MINMSMIQGILNHDIVVKKTEQGTPVINFVLKCDRYRDEKSDHIQCVAFGDKATIISKRYRQGDVMIIEGEIMSGDKGQMVKVNKIYTTGAERC